MMHFVGGFVHFERGAGGIAGEWIPGFDLGGLVVAVVHADGWWGLLFGGSGSSRHSSNDSIGMTKTFNDQFFLDVIGTSYCRSRAIACTQDEYKQLETWRIAKGQVIATHQTWVDSITKQCDQLKIGLKAYRYLSEAIELATELGIEVEESELIRTNSTGLTIYNPKNLADMIKGLKNNKPLTTAQKIEARKQYEASVN